jgi:hypothetical protein
VILLPGTAKAALKDPEAAIHDVTMPTGVGEAESKKVTFPVGAGGFVEAVVSWIETAREREPLPNMNVAAEGVTVVEVLILRTWREIRFCVESEDEVVDDPP